MAANVVVVVLVVSSAATVVVVLGSGANVVTLTNVVTVVSVAASDAEHADTTRRIAPKPRAVR